MRKWMILATLMACMAMALPAAAQTAAGPRTGHESHGAQEAAKSSPQTAGHESHGGHDAAKPGAAAEAVPANTHDHASGRHGRMMDAQMKEMQALTAKMRTTADPEERRKLMQEHMAAMKSGMKMMKEMPDGPMMAGGMKCGEAGKAKPMAMGPMACQQTMGKKMEMMQVMMEGLIEASPTKP